jgi:hypothetical protein
MTRLGLLTLVAALGACSPYVQNDSSAAAGGSAPGSLLVRVNPDSAPQEERTLPTDYPDFRPGDRVRILADGKVVPM